MDSNTPERPRKKPEVIFAVDPDVKRMVNRSIGAAFVVVALGVLALALAMGGI